ncbi:hypothetical protein Tco_0774429 [Tanacetum coccineum]|uniref:Uncharacterized protein n=1 Tax=Tanacetum coccineum TaxID=301880 RepID=A0ABQ4ZSS4_9ASTR
MSDSNIRFDIWSAVTAAIEWQIKLIRKSEYVVVLPRNIEGTLGNPDSATCANIYERHVHEGDLVGINCHPAKLGECTSEEPDYSAATVAICILLLILNEHETSAKEKAPRTQSIFFEAPPSIFPAAIIETHSFAVKLPYETITWSANERLHRKIGSSLSYQRDRYHQDKIICREEGYNQIARCTLHHNNSQLIVQRGSKVHSCNTVARLGQEDSRYNECISVENPLHRFSGLCQYDRAGGRKVLGTDDHQIPLYCVDPATTYEIHASCLTERILDLQAMYRLAKKYLSPKLRPITKREALDN